MENQRKFSHFEEPLTLIQVTERRLPVHLIGSVKDEGNHQKAQKLQ